MSEWNLHVLMIMAPVWSIVKLLWNTLRKHLQNMCCFRLMAAVPLQQHLLHWFWFKDYAKTKKMHHSRVGWKPWEDQDHLCRGCRWGHFCSRATWSHATAQLGQTKRRQSKNAQSRCRCHVKNRHGHRHPHNCCGKRPDEQTTTVFAHTEGSSSRTDTDQTAA